MKNRFLSLLCVLALCLGLLPVTALAAAPPENQVLYVGGVPISSTGYWTTDDKGSVTAYTGGDTPTDNYIHYDAGDNTLTLHNATIKKQLDYSENIEGGTYIFGSAIGVLNQNGAAELTITLEGTNTIAEVGKGIFVLASSTSTGGATLTITGGGSLDASASQTGIWVQSNSNNAALCVENAEVTASVDGAFNDGVLVQAKDGSDVSLTVNGGSLTASVNANIWFQFGSGLSGSGTPTVTVSNNAIVRANGGIANTSSTSIQYGTGNEENGGIVFDGNEGTVYGSVTLQEDLTVGEGERLNIPSGASLTIDSDATLTVNGGELTGEKIPTEGVVYKVTEVKLDKDSLSLEVGGTATLTATITPNNATDKSVTWESSAPSVADVAVNADGSATVTAVSAGTATITVTTADGSGEKATCSVTVHAAAVSVTGVSLNKTELTLTEGDSETLTATVEPSDATNQNVTWSSDNEAVATVNNGNVTAVAPGTAAITVTTADGNKTAVCTVTVSKRSSSGSSGGSDSEPSYSPILETEGEGTVKVDPRTPGQGDAVTVTPTPDRGWDVGSVTVTDRNGREIDVTERRNSTWTFEQPRGRVTIAVTFVPAGGTAPFADVPEGHWAEAAIRYVWENGLMNGTSAASFNPGGTVSRQQVWMILARMAGADPADMAAAKAWAVDSGISDGTSPGGAVTRQQFAALLYRFAVMMGYDVSVGESTNILSYADAFDAAEYAIPALQWACGAGIIHGTGDGSTLSPQGTATRAQAAVMLERFCEWNK